MSIPENESIQESLDRLNNEAETRAASEPVASAPATLRPPAQYSAFGPRSARLGGWAFLFCAPDGVHYRRWYSWRERVIPWQDVAGAFTYVTAGADGYSLYGVGIRMTGGGTRVKNLCAWGDNTAQDAVDTIEAWREYYGPRVPATRERSDGDASQAAGHHSRSCG